jgi:phosphopantothenoylcysteine decarboxylase
MAQLILGVTGSVAAIRTPALFAMLREAGHQVRVVATRPALYFFDPAELAPLEESSSPTAGGGPVLCDADEWPGARYQRGDLVLHIELRNWAEVLIVAPLDANTLAKTALGLSDNLLSSIIRAWDFSKPIILAPAMNTRMWESPVTLRHLRFLLEDHAAGPIDARFSLEDAPSLFARHAPRIVLVPPQSKRLACGDVGKGAMAEVVAIAEVVRRWSEAGDA